MTATKPDAPETATGSQSGPAGGKANYITGIADGNLAAPIGLRDFLFGIGVVFRLDRRRKRQQKPQESAAKRFVARIPVRLLATVLTPIGLAIVGYNAYQQWSGEPLPGPLVGTWSTSDGRYAGRSFWLNPRAVAFQNGATTGDFSTHDIRKVTTRQVADTLYLTIDYEQEGKPLSLSVIYRETPAPELRLANQPAVRWARVGGAPAIKP
jgi:hypothetical protein